MVVKLTESASRLKCLSIIIIITTILIICYKINVTIERPHPRLLERSQLALRGALGYSLRSTNEDLFRYIFKPARSFFRGFALRKLRSIPKPLIISPLYKDDSNYYFIIRIFGKAIYYTDGIVHALISLGERTLYGSKIHVNSIDLINEIGNKVVNIYDGKVNDFNIQEYIIKDDDIKEFAKHMVKSNSIIVDLNFITPLSILRNGKNVIEDDSLNLADIVAYAARRRSLLSYFYLNNKMYYTPDYVNQLKEWCNNNSSVIERKFIPINISIKGKRGFYKGNITFNINNDNTLAIDVVDLLKFSEFVGIGKSSAFGMGQYKLSIK